MSDKTTGAVRSKDADHLDFSSMPLLGLIGVARTSQEGAVKYGRYNYMKGFSVHELLNHSIRHILMFLLGDRSEPHLEHAAWGLLAAIQSYTLDPELSAKHLLGPGATLTPANLAHLAEQEAELGPKRAAGEFADAGNWKLFNLAEIKTILGQRRGKSNWTRIVNSACKKFAKDLNDLNGPDETVLKTDVILDENFKGVGHDECNQYFDNTTYELTDLGKMALGKRPSPGITVAAGTAEPAEGYPFMNIQDEFNAARYSFVKPRTQSHVPVERNRNDESARTQLKRDRKGKIRADMNKALEVGKITAEEYSQWHNHGTLPGLFYGK